MISLSLSTAIVDIEPNSLAFSFSSALFFILSSIIDLFSLFFRRVSSSEGIYETVAVDYFNEGKNMSIEIKLGKQSQESSLLEHPGK